MAACNTYLHTEYICYIHLYIDMGYIHTYKCRTVEPCHFVAAQIQILLHYSYKQSIYIIFIYAYLCSNKHTHLRTVKPCHFVAVEVQLLILLTYLVFSAGWAHCMLTRTYRIFFLFLVFYFASFFSYAFFLHCQHFAVTVTVVVATATASAAALAHFASPPGAQNLGHFTICWPNNRYRIVLVLFSSLLFYNSVSSLFIRHCAYAHFHLSPIRCSHANTHTHRYTYIRMCAVVSAYLAYHMFVGM